MKAKTFIWKETELEIGSFDNDKEIELCITKYDESVYTFISPNQANELINHLAECLKSINEPVDLLNERK